MKMNFTNHLRLATLKSLAKKLKLEADAEKAEKIVETFLTANWDSLMGSELELALDTEELTPFKENDRVYDLGLNLYIEGLHRGYIAGLAAMEKLAMISEEAPAAGDTENKEEKSPNEEVNVFVGELESFVGEVVEQSLEEFSELDATQLRLKAGLARSTADVYQEALNDEGWTFESGAGKKDLAFKDLPPEERQDILLAFLIEHGMNFHKLDQERQKDYLRELCQMRKQTSQDEK